ncbi:MAG: HlyC/CorC family transporter [Syntrophaceae bacterium]|jgi:putative hemolysin|nr:HlyC/CorC family transporter [Syntrophaceae bacterium]HOC61360.1 hemolysin family protein [Smithellaceae bacterium]HQM45277.1 hemolysin family protein [Smithellaceae bacterium]
MSLYLVLALILICVALEALYSGGEVALFSADINKIKYLAGKGSLGARQALKLKENPEWFISTALIGTNLAIIIASTLGTGLLIQYFGSQNGERIAFVIMPFALFGIILVRSIFQHYPEYMAVRVAHFIRLSSYVFYPLAWFVAVVSRGAVNISFDEKTDQSPYITKEGLKYLLGEKTEGGDILAKEKEMVSRVFDFSELTAEKIMVPVSALTLLPQNMPIEEAARVVAAKKYMRIPVYAETVYNIVGMLHYFDLLGALIRQKQMHDKVQSMVGDCMRTDVYYVPETKKAGPLFMDLQRKREHMAVVVDEYGGAVGIVTMEDIGEEIVGSIDEAYNKGEKLFKKVSPGRYLVNGRMKIEDLNQTLSVTLPEGHYETIGGFLAHLAGRIPVRREIFEYEDVVFVIENADQKSVREALVIVPQPVELTEKKK